MLLLAAAAAAAAAPTCDYRLVEESKYSAFSLHGLSTTKSICMNDYFSTSHADMTLQDVIDAPNATIRENALKIAAHTINGTDTTSLVILDLEYPIQYNEMWYYNDSLLAAIVGAVRRRVQITQTIFPRAPIALYDEHAQLNATVMEGYRRASALGLWDDVAFLIPVLYMGGAKFENATNRTIEVLTATAGHKTTSRGAAIPMAPVASWLYFPNQCAMPFAVAHEILATIERLSYTLPPQPTPFPIVHFWSGKDNETSQASGKDRPCDVPPTAQRDWLEGAQIVPKRCL